MGGTFLTAWPIGLSREADVRAISSAPDPSAPIHELMRLSVSKSMRCSKTRGTGLLVLSTLARVLGRVCCRSTRVVVWRLGDITPASVSRRASLWRGANVLVSARFSWVNCRVLRSVIRRESLARTCTASARRTARPYSSTAAAARLASRTTLLRTAPNSFSVSILDVRTLAGMTCPSAIRVRVSAQASRDRWAGAFAPQPPPRPRSMGGTSSWLSAHSRSDTVQKRACRRGVRRIGSWTRTHTRSFSDRLWMTFRLLFPSGSARLSWVSPSPSRW